MKISGRGIDPFLANPPQDISSILLYGHDRGMINERSRNLAERYVSDINDPFCVTSLDGDAIAKDPTLLIDSAGAMPPMGGIRLVRVDRISSNGLAACKNLLASPPPESIVILTGDDDLNTKSALVKLFEQTDHAAALGCYADNNQSLGHLAAELFRQYNIRADRDVLAYITAHLGADRMASRSEIDKLVILAGQDGHLTLDQVQHALGDGADVSVNDAIHAAASGNMSGLSTALARLEQNAIAGEQVLRSGQFYFQRLFRISAAMETGLPRDQAMNSVRPPVFFNEKRMVESHLQHWSAPRCRRAIDRLIEAEQQSRHGISSQTAAAQALTALAIAVKQ